MATTDPSRIFASGDATRSYVTTHTQTVSDSHVPFDADDDVTVTVDGERPDVTEADEGADG